MAAAAITIVPRHVIGKGHVAPSDRLNIAGIGVGNRGAADLTPMAVSENIVALCDVHDTYAAKTFEGALGGPVSDSVGARVAVKWALTRMEG